MRKSLSAGVLLAGALFAAQIDAAEERIDFNYQIRPILSDRCFKCHGPDPKGRKADLRLDIAEGAFAVCDKKTGAHAINPRHPEKSEVIRRIASHDPDEQMPPPNSHLSISQQEVATLRRWIEQGAEYKQHWAFLPIQKQTPPSTKSKWARNAIDQFALARLQKENFAPSAEATRETLIRRASFDLTGLPPTIQEIDAFLQDKAPNAYEKMIDRLLASPAYGERMANDWLDLARYADTYGYQSDVERDMSPWRDWVIRAFNQNLAYDKFMMWQIAGDLLPNATDEQILATAFNRLHRQTNEGGSIEEEFRNEYCADRVQTFGTAFLGLTFECARCHDHKYDPITQRDYYSLMAFFNNIDESGLYSHFTHATPTPTMLLYRAGEHEKHIQLKHQIAAVEQELASIFKSSSKISVPSDSGETNTSVTPLVKLSFEQLTGPVVGSASNATVSFVEAPQQTDGPRGKALQLNGENGVVIKSVAHFTRTDPFTFSLWLKPSAAQERAVVFHHSRSWTDAGSRGYELLLEKGRPSFALVHFWPGNAIRVRLTETLPTNEWTHLTITYDGSSRASGIRMYRNGQCAAVETIRDNLYKDISYRSEWGDFDVGNIDLTIGFRFRDSGFKSGSIDEFQIFGRALTPLEVRAVYDTGFSLAKAHPSEVKDYFTQRDLSYVAAVTRLKALREEESKFVNDIPEIMVMKEMPTRRPTFVLRRGAYDAPTDRVSPNTPSKIFPFPKNAPPNRLGLAQWLTDPRNPLPARVVVNRIWKIHFGRGLVATPENFGSQGQLPTHPQMLDWLAKKFVESGWNIKALHKLIMMSATYRQSSVASLAILAADPDNRLLARGPKHRLDAEEIRDAALSVSGLLSKKIGGPSVKPYQPAGLWEQSGLAKTYVQDKGENLYRRSLYTFWRRTSPPPSMTTFDATSREVCTARRETTATPLQSLVLLNDPQFVEASRVLAEKILLNGKNDTECIDEVFRALVGRVAVPNETTVLHDLLREQRDLFHSDADAEKYLGIGEHPRDRSLSAREVAALTVVVNTLMNHDEFVTER